MEPVDPKMLTRRGIKRASYAYSVTLCGPLGYDRCPLPARVVVVVVVFAVHHRPAPVVARPRPGRVAGRRRRPVLLAEGVDAYPDAPAETGQHQQQAKADEAHADDLGRRADADRVGDGDRDGADEQEPGADGDHDQRAAVVR